MALSCWNWLGESRVSSLPQPLSAIIRSDGCHGSNTLTLPCWSEITVVGVHCAAATTTTAADDLSRGYTNIVDGIVRFSGDGRSIQGWRQWRRTHSNRI